MNMQITIFVHPDSIHAFVSTVRILSKLDMDNDFKFEPTDIVFSEKMISDYMWVTVDMLDYLKLRYCIDKLKNRKIKK